MDWKGFFMNEAHGWLNLIIGAAMIFFAAFIGEIGKIGDWLFKKKG